MSEYDSILKEKKKKHTEVVSEEPKKFPKFWVSLFLIIIVLIVSYIIYFNKFLNSKYIFVHDSLKLFNRYSSLIKNIPIEEFKNENNLVGVIDYGQDKFNFNMVKNSNNLGFNISNGDKYINYYLLDNKPYVKVPSINEYVVLDYTLSFNTLLKFFDIIDSISDDYYTKNIYFENKKPIVEVNIMLTSNELNDLLGLNLVDDYEVIITLKNSAIMNELEELKVSINNKSRSKRSVITMYSNVIECTVGKDKYNMILEENSNNFVLKTSKNDVLYSVFSGTDNDGSYLYSYQVMDMVYKIDVTATKNTNGYLYEVISKKGDITENIKIDLKVENTYLIEHDATNFIEKDNKLINDKYNMDINYFKDKWLKFIDKGNK